MPTIAVIDDDQSFLDSVTLALKDRGTVISTTDPRDCEKLLSNTQIGLLITDYKMRYGCGAQVLQSVRISRPELPVILVSAYATKEMAIAAANLHVFSILEKPVGYHELMRTVDLALLRSKRSDQNFNSLLKMNCDDQSVTVHGKSVSLTSIEYRLLALLVENEGNCISREQLISSIWGESVLCKNVFDTHLGNLKKKISGLGVNLRTIRGKGYIYSRTPPGLRLHG
ncbi:MAG: response regulator transcription factor [Methylotenera sp.]|nr:response regulator transcription factor [Oligoflexia bacterium]